MIAIAEAKLAVARQAIPIDKIQVSEYIIQLLRHVYACCCPVASDKVEVCDRVGTQRITYTTGRPSAVFTD